MKQLIWGAISQKMGDPVLVAARLSGGSCIPHFQQKNRQSLWLPPGGVIRVSLNPLYVFFLTCFYLLILCEFHIMHAKPRPLSVPSNPPSALAEGIPLLRKRKQKLKTNEQTIHFTTEAEVCHTVHTSCPNNFPCKCSLQWVRLSGQRYHTTFWHISWGQGSHTCLPVLYKCTQT